MEKLMDKFFIVYAPKLMLILWFTLIINHMLRGLFWQPLLIMVLPLVLLIKYTKKG